MKAQTIFLILILSVFIRVTGQDYFFKQYSIEEGLNHSFIYALNQDVDGFMWIGTAEGLYRFDGFNFDYFSTEDGIAGNFVTKIFKDKNDRLWFGHQNGSITNLNLNVFTILNADSDVQGSVTDITEDERGYIWFTIQNQGLLFVNKNLQATPVSFSIDDEPLSQIEPLGDDYFLIGTQDNVYFSKFDIRSGSMLILKKIDDYPGSKVVEILSVSQDSYIIFSQDEGFGRFNFNTTDIGYDNALIDNNSDGILDNLQGGMINGKGELWLNTLGSGVIRYREINGNFIRIGSVTTTKGLVSDNVKSVFQDIEGNIWLGMYGEGLLRYVDDNLKFFRYGKENELNKISALTGDGISLLIVQDNRLLRLSPSSDSILNSYTLPCKKSGDRINSAFMDDEGSLWLGCEHSGIYVAEDSKLNFKSVDISNDDLANSINYITGNGVDIWVGTKRGVCKINKKSGEIKWFTSDDGLPHNNIQHVHIGSDQKVLVATLCSEIFYIDKNDLVKRVDKSWLGPANHLVSLFEDEDGAIWAGTDGNGVWKIEEDGSINYNRNTGLLSDFCYSIGATSNGMILVGHRGGISKIDPKTYRVNVFAQLSGVNSSTEFYTNAIFTDPMGDQWFGTSEGLVRYSSEISKGGMMPPKIQITRMHVNGKEMDFTADEIVLNPGQYELKIDYIGINFTNPEMVQYKTKLEGYNTNWTSLSDIRSIQYDRLGHGNYIFKLKAFNENNISSELSSGIVFKIKKPIYLRIWFYGLMVIILGSVFYMIIIYREEKLRTEQERLLKNLDEKTKDIIVKEEIIKERKKIEKELRTAKNKAELSEKLKTSFLKNMSHEIRTPMNAILGFAQLLDVDNISPKKHKEYLSIVSNNTKSLLVMIDDILDLSSLESNQLILKQRTCRIKDMINDLDSSYRTILDSNGKDGIELISKSPEGDDNLEFYTDPERLKQVFMKLLDNAVKYTESGKITFGYELEQGNISFFVEDTGIGLSENKRGLIFDLFRKVEEDKLKLYRGIGLGLTLSKYLVNLLGGKIDVDSKEDVGSRFYFSLPIGSI